MTPEQKFFFDLNGWILLPAVLTDAEIAVMKQEVSAGAKQAYQGELQNLLDHDGIVDILTEILAHWPYPVDDSYGFRCEHSHISVRPPGWQDEADDDFRGTNVPHVVAVPQQANAMRYQVAGDKIFSGLTRVVWELEEVKSGGGGTTFLSGSHKAHFSFGGPDPLSSGRPQLHLGREPARGHGRLQLSPGLSRRIHREPATRFQRLDEPREPTVRCF